MKLEKYFRFAATKSDTLLLIEKMLLIISKAIKLEISQVAARLAYRSWMNIF